MLRKHFKRLISRWSEKKKKKKKKKKLNGYAYNFSVDYDAIAVADILDIQKYLMKKMG